MRRLAAIWGVGGVLYILGQAVVRLTGYAVEAFTGGYPFHWYHWSFLAGFTVFMLYSEGYKGFQQKFSPRVVSRARYLAGNATLLQGLLAPFFCMGFFYASRRRQIIAWTLITVMVGLVILVRLTPQPWRGLIDVGVVLGLGWGMVAILAYTGRVLLGLPFDYPPDLPEAGDKRPAAQGVSG